MKKLYFLFLSLSTILAFGQDNYLVENFDYAPGALLTDNGWCSHSAPGTNSMDVASGSLSFTNYIGSAVGNAALVDNTGSDENKIMSDWITSGSAYASFLMKPNSAATTSNDGYFFHFLKYANEATPNCLEESSLFRGRVFFLPGSTASDFKLGLSYETGTFPSNDSVSPFDLTGDLNLADTYLVVVKYTFVDGADNDTVSLFVFADGDNLTTEPGTPTLGPLPFANSEIGTIQGIGLRQYAAAEDLTVDGFYVRNEWNLIDAGTNLCTVALGIGTASCNANTAGNDNDSVTINIPYSGLDASITSVTTTSGGVVGGDNPNSISDGTITITGLSEGDAWDILLNGGACDGRTASGSVPSAECDPRFLVINEVLADPASDITGDANGDGVRDSSDDEFVEIYNTDSNPIDLENYTISDASGVRHIFPASSIVLANNFITVFGGGTPDQNIDEAGAVIQVATATSLGFNNSADVVTLKDPFGTIVAQFDYSGGGIDQSFGRSPDFTGSFVDHTTIVTALFSPGKKNDGTTLSTGDFEPNSLLIYPNPVSNGFVTIKSQLSGIKSIELYDMLGRSVLNTTLNSDVLNVSSIKSGLYLLEVSIGDRSSTTKLIIK